MGKPSSKTFPMGSRNKISFLKSKTAVDPANVKDTEQISGQTKNYSITISMQKSFNQSTRFSNHL